MSDWIRRTLGMLALGGGFAGLTAYAPALFTDISAGSKILMMLLMPLCAWGVWCGVQMIERHPNAIRNNLRFWIVQVPILYSSVLSYLFSTGLIAGVWVQFSPLKINFLILGGFHSDVVLNEGGPLAIGLNVLALLICMKLWRLLRAGPSDDFIERQPSVEEVD